MERTIHGEKKGGDLWLLYKLHNSHDLLASYRYSTIDLDWGRRRL